MAQADPLSVRQTFFTNLLCLGFNTEEAEAKHRIPFTKDMFHLPNRRAFEVVIHFLFDKLDAVKCYDVFRNCWPHTLDKKQEQLFRKTSSAWLSCIAKDNPDKVQLSRNAASILMSPWGDRFYDLMFSLSTHVLLTWIKNAGVKSRDIIQHPILKPQTMAMGSSMKQTLQVMALRHQESFFRNCRENIAAHKEWKDFFSKQTKEHRSLVKKIREKINLIQAECQNKKSGGMSHKRSGLVDDYQLDVEAVKRTQKLHKVRDQWRELDNFSTSLEQEIRVMKTVVDNRGDRDKIDATNWDICIPEMLLRKCELELSQRRINNVYHEGQVNLVSLIHLTSLCLNLYIEKFRQVGLPNVKEQLPILSRQIHVNHVHLANAKALWAKMAKEVFPALNKTITELESRVNQQEMEFTSPHSRRSLNLGLDLLPSTPPFMFSGKSPAGDTRGRFNVMSPAVAPKTVSTPEGVSSLQMSIENKVKQSRVLPTQSYACSPLLLASANDRTDLRSRIPTVQVEKKARKQTTRIRVPPVQDHQQYAEIQRPHVKEKPVSHSASMTGKKKRNLKVMKTRDKGEDILVEQIVTAVTGVGEDICDPVVDLDPQEAFASREKLTHSPQSNREALTTALKSPTGSFTWHDMLKTGSPAQHSNVTPKSAKYAVHASPSIEASPRHAESPKEKSMFSMEWTAETLSPYQTVSRSRALDSQENSWPLSPNFGPRESQAETQGSQAGLVESQPSGLVPVHTAKVGHSDSLASVIKVGHSDSLASVIARYKQFKAKLQKSDPEVSNGRTEGKVSNGDICGVTGGMAIHGNNSDKTTLEADSIDNQINEPLLGHLVDITPPNIDVTRPNAGDIQNALYDFSHISESSSLLDEIYLQHSPDEDEGVLLPPTP